MHLLAADTRDKRLGEILISYNLITDEQLDRALKVQSQQGGHLGTVLVELDYLKVQDLVDLLGLQFGLPTANLFALDIEPEVIGLLPLDKMKAYRVLPIAAGARSIFLAMVNPRDINAIKEIEFIIGKSIQPVVVPAIQIAAALEFIGGRGGSPCGPMKGKELEEFVARSGHGFKSTELKELFRLMVERRASDLLLSAGVPPCLKKDNELTRVSATFLAPEDTERFARQLMSEMQREEFGRMRELDFAFTYPDIGRFRVNAYLQRNSVSLSVRHITETIPDLEELGLPQWVEEYALRTQGLILVTGPTGHGKTTTLAALVDLINRKRRCNIITIEDPIEYLHKHKSSNVNQREVGLDTDSFSEGLRHIFRQSPDVIVIGEMRDPESFAIALQAAETGHLVISTMHANNATSALERMIDVFPPQQQQQIRVQLSESFLVVLNQRLVPKENGEGVILACEKLIGSVRSRNLVREGKTHQIRSMLQQSGEDYESIDIVLARLCRERKITFDAGLNFCDSIVHYKQLAGSGK